MSWVTIIWSMVASACLTLGAMHFLAWCWKRTAWSSLLFPVTAVATAALAYCELSLMRADTPEQFGAVMRWIHVPIWVLILALVGLVRLRLRAGRLWLAWAVCALRTIALIANFMLSGGLNYRSIVQLQQVPFLGDQVSIAQAIPNPWTLIGHLGSALLLAFVIDATITVWRRGDRRQALIVGGSTILFVLGASVQAALVIWGLLRWPAMLSPFYLGIVAATAFEMIGEALRAEQLSDDLHESEARMTLAAEATGVGVWIWSIARNQVWGSERWLGLFGFGHAQNITVEAVLERIHPDDRQRVERGVRCASADRTDYIADYRVILPNNSERWFVTRGRVYPDANGKPARMLGITIDITERKRTELALAESELRYRTLFDAVPQGILVIGPDGCVQAANSTQARLYGYDSPQQLEGLYAPMFVAEKERVLAAQNMRALLNGEEQPSRRYTGVRRDGSEFLAEVTSAVLRGPRQELEGYLCLTRDITDSEQAAAALKQSEERFRQVAEIAGEFIWEVDAKGLYTYASPSVQRILGYAPDELVGKKHFYDLFVPEVRTELKRIAFQAFAGCHALHNFPNANVSKSGQTVYLETSGAPMLDRAGNLIGYRGADTDVSERKQAALEIAERRSELAHLARVTMLGELSGSLAHELNQPLTAILSNAQAAQRFLERDQIDVDEVRAILHDIVEDDKRAGETIRRLRLLLKKGELELKSLDMNELIRDVLKLVNSDLVNQGVNVRTELDPGLPAVYGDRVQLQQVLLNLIMNGCEAMSRVNSGHRNLLLRSELADGKGVQVCVSDRGCGIPLERLEQVFEPFFTTKAQGMGLGLAVCRTITSAHGGRLWASSNPNGGASFHLTLPAHADGASNGQS